MFSLTPQERKVILSLIVLILSGSIIKFFNLDSKIVNNFGFSKVQATGSSSRVKTATDIININTASLAELEKIPGVGRVIAQRIAIYRKEAGLFTNIESLKKVKGIGDKKAEAMRNYISF